MSHFRRFAEKVGLAEEIYGNPQPQQPVQPQAPQQFNENDHYTAINIQKNLSKATAALSEAAHSMGELQSQQFATLGPLINGLLYDVEQVKAQIDSFIRG